MIIVIKCINDSTFIIVGKSDGSVDGVRYFYTDPQRALFVRPSDLEILYHQK
jgi:dynactin complex subunit